MKKTRLILLFLTLLGTQPIYAQIDQMRELMQDQMTEMEEGKLTLRFINAVDGNAVPDATIHIDKLGEYKTDRQGRVLFEIPDDGILSMGFEKPGFIPANLRFEVIKGTIFYNRFSVSPIVDVGTIRIVLDWGRDPEDLDAHLLKQGSYHISYRYIGTSADGKATLDRDDRDSWGPETITVKDIDENAEYEYYVKDYTNRDRDNSKALSKSKARVKVYDKEGLINEFMITEKQKGNTWLLFTIKNGKLIPRDEVNRYY